MLYRPASNQIAVAGGADGTFKLFDGTTCCLVKSLGSLADADNLRFDPKANLVYVGYGEGALAVIDTAGVTQTADIKLAGHPESFQLEQRGTRIFVNVPDAHHVAVIDQRNADTYTRRERLPTRDGARTAFFSDERDVLYLAVPKRGGQDAEIRVYQPQCALLHPVFGPIGLARLPLVPHGAVGLFCNLPALVFASEQARAGRRRARIGYAAGRKSC